MSEIERNKFISMLYENYFDRLVLFCRRLTRYQPELSAFVEECVQDVFRTAIIKYPKLANHSDIEGWFFRSCINRMNTMLKTYYSRKNRHAYSMDGDAIVELHDPNDSFRLMEEDDAYQDTLDRIYTLLLESEKDIFDLYFLQGHDLEHISKHVGKSKSSVKSTIYRIRKRLKNSLYTKMIILFLTGASFLHNNK